MMNWNNLSYKVKNKYLIAGGAFFLIIAYILAFNKTLELYLFNKAQKAKLIHAKEAPEKRRLMEIKSNALKEKLSSYFADSLKDQGHLLEVVSIFCSKNNLLLQELPNEEFYEDKEFIIGTTKLKVEGHFTDLLKLLYLLEQKEAVGRVTSSSFDMIYDNKRKKKVLVLTMYIQTLKIKLKNNKKDDAKI
jgi:hypothetical protein